MGDLRGVMKTENFDEATMSEDEKKHLDADTILNYFVQCVLALEELHRHDHAHGAVASDHILLKLIDSANPNGLRCAVLSQFAMLRDYGSPYYMSPENLLLYRAVPR